MGRTLSPAAVASQNAENSDEVYLALVTIDHPDLATPIRVVADFANITSNGAEYVGCPFELELPGQAGDESIGEARLAVDNVDRQIVEAVRTIQSPPTVDLQVVLASQPDTVELAFTGLSMRDVSWDAFKVSGSLRFEDIIVEPIADMITPERFPGLF